MIDSKAGVPLEHPLCIFNGTLEAGGWSETSPAIVPLWY